MAFKSISQYNEERYGGFFTLADDGDYADVIILYQNPDDAVVCDTHYIKSSEYTGYVQCIGHGCPACRKGLRVQTKLFVPLYDVNTGEVLIFDRSVRFSTNLNTDVFRHTSNPSEYVFRITRHGAARSMDTTYELRIVGRNSIKSMDLICAEKGISFPAYYNTVCKEVTADQLSAMLNMDGDNGSGGSFQPTYNPSSIPEYHVTPRAPANAPPPPVYEPDAAVDPLSPDNSDIIAPTFGEGTGDFDPSDMPVDF